MKKLFILILVLCVSVVFAKGGHYKNGKGSSHKGGDYKNAKTYNHYRHHK